MDGLLDQSKLSKQAIVFRSSIAGVLTPNKHKDEKLKRHMKEFELVENVCCGTNLIHRHAGKEQESALIDRNFRYNTTLTSFSAGTTSPL